MASLRVTEILSQVTGGSGAVSDLPRRLVQSCAAALPVTGVGLALMSDTGSAGVVAVTDGPAATLEELQFTLGEGPCLDCSRSGRPVLQPDLARTGPQRWPGYAAGALEAGIRAVFAFPLRIGGIRVGVLDLYRDSAGPLDDDELAGALSFADAATTVLLHLQARVAPRGGLESIPVIDDRAEVHQATGVIAVQAAMTLADALVSLRARAFSTDEPITSLAERVLEGTLSSGDIVGDDGPRR